MKIEKYEIVVIGAGPAGSSFLKHLQKDLKNNTILIEKEELPRKNTREAELVEETIEILKEEYKKIPKYIFSKPKFLDIYYIDFDNKVKVYEKRNLWNIDREKFDFWLFKKSKAENVMRGELVRIIKNRGLYLIKVKTGSSLKKIKAKYIVGADGTLSKVREFLGYKGIKYYFGYQEWIRYNFSKKCMYFIYDSEISKYYSWVIPKNELIVLGTTLLPKQKNTIGILKEKIGKYFQIFGEVIKKKTDITIRSSPNRIFLGNDKIFLVGEAAGLISPSTAEGISFALRSGKYCAEVLNKGGDLNEYKEMCQELINEIKEKYKKLKILQHPQKRIKLWEKIGKIEKL